MKNPFVHEKMSKARSKFTDATKKEFPLNNLENLLILYIGKEIFFCNQATLLQVILV